MVAKYLCPVLLMELLSCLHCFETSFDRCKPQLYTEVLLLSLEIFLTDSASFKKTRFIMDKASHLCRATYWGWSIKVSCHRLPQYSTSCKLVSRKTNLLARVTSLSFVRERKIPSTANCHVLQLLIYDSPGYVAVNLPSHTCLI